MGSKHLLLVCVVAVTCASTIRPALFQQFPQQEVQELFGEAPNGGVNSNHLQRRFRSASTRFDFGRTFDAPLPCFGPATFFCPYPDLLVLCREIARSSPCKQTQFLTVDI